MTKIEEEIREALEDLILEQNNKITLSSTFKVLELIMKYYEEEN